MVWPLAAGAQTQRAPARRQLAPKTVRVAKADRALKIKIAPAMTCPHCLRSLKLNGSITLRWPDGSKRAVGPTRNGVQDGRWTYYWPSGTKMAVITYGVRARPVRKVWLANGTRQNKVPRVGPRHVRVTLKSAKLARELATRMLKMKQTPALARIRARLVHAAAVADALGSARTEPKVMLRALVGEEGARALVGETGRARGEGGMRARRQSAKGRGMRYRNHTSAIDKSGLGTVASASLVTEVLAAEMVFAKIQDSVASLGDLSPPVSDTLRRWRSHTRANLSALR